MATEYNQGGELPLDSLGSSSSGASGSRKLTADVKTLTSMVTPLKNIATYVSDIATKGPKAVTAINGLFSAMSGGRGVGGVTAGLSGGGSGRTSVPTAGTGSIAPPPPPPGGGGGGTLMPPTGGGGGGGGNLGSSLTRVLQTSFQPMIDASRAASSRFERGAEYGLQADRMTVQLQQMYGMSNSQVRQQLRLPLTNNYLLGGGTAINDLLAMQASTGLTASKQARTVEALRASSGFSLGSGDVTRMLSTMASPDVANRMFMMGGTGMYGLGGKERTGMQSIQDIVKRTGLTNPEALKGALQQGSNTRQRLSAMGVPDDMQDMVIQYAMQNTQYQRKTGDKNRMYDPSMEADRRTMGIEETYAVQHEKTTGERLKREEKFYDKNTGAYAQMEKNLRLSTQALTQFEQALSGVSNVLIGMKGHPLTNAAQYGVKQLYNQTMAKLDFVGNLVGTAAGALIPGGDPTVGNWGIGGDSVSDANEAKLAQLDPKLATPLRRMLEENPKLRIGDAKRSSAQQERSFKARYTPRPDLKEKTKPADRIWNGVVWVHDNHADKKTAPAMAPPGQSWHEKGLAADVFGDDNWIKANAARFGLGHGGTGTGGADDEPFHIQPASTMGQSPDKSSSAPASAKKASVSKTSVSQASVAPSLKNKGQYYSPSGSMSANAGAMAAAAEREGLKAQFGPTIAGVEQVRGGDPTVGMPMGAIQGSSTITVAPTIYLTTSGDHGGDLQRLAREVGRLLEKEVSMVMARSR